MLKSSVGESTLQLQLDDGADQELAGEIVRSLVGIDPVLSPGSRRMNVPLEDANGVADILIALRDAAIVISSFSVAKPTLDEVFLALTGHDTGEAETDDELTFDEQIPETR